MNIETKELICSLNRWQVRCFIFLYLWLGLNGRLKHAKSNITVVAFIIIPAKNHSYTVESLRSQAEMKQLRQTVNQIQHSIGQRLFESASRYELYFSLNFVRSETPDPSKMLSEEDLVLLKGRILASRRIW